MTPRRCDVCGGPLAARWAADEPFNVYDCRDCGLGHTWPFPEEANGGEVFADDDGHYERQFATGRELWRIFALNLLERIPPVHRKGRILDVGAGVGFFVELAAEQGASAYGIDRAPAAGRVARRHGVDVRTCELEEVMDDDFDVVVMTHVLEHVPDPVNFLREAARRLRAGGVLVINVPVSKALMPRLLGRRWYGYQPTQHVHQFSRRSLRQVARRAGLEPLSLSSESLHYTNESPLKRAVLVSAATLGRVIGAGDQATLVARR